MTSAACAAPLRPLSVGDESAPKDSTKASENATSKAAAAAAAPELYVYPSPGSSLKDPLYPLGGSTNDPVYVVDRPPRRPSPNLAQVQQAAAAAAGGARTAASSSSRRIVQQASQEQKQQQAVEAAATGASMDDAQPPYVYLPPGCSVRDPTYGASVLDPVYEAYPRKRGGSSSGGDGRGTPPTQPAAASHKQSAEHQHSGVAGAGGAVKSSSAGKANDGETAEDKTSK